MGTEPSPLLSASECGAGVELNLRWPQPAVLWGQSPLKLHQRVLTGCHSHAKRSEALEIIYSIPSYS